MNYLSRFDYIIIFSILFCALIFELYHKNTITNLNNAQKDKFKQQHSLIITPKLDQESFDYSLLLRNRINIFYNLFEKNLLDRKYFMRHYYNNKELDTNVYFRINIEDRTIYLNFFSNSYNQNQSFYVVKQIKEYVSNDIWNLIINELDKLNNFELRITPQLLEFPSENKNLHDKINKELLMLPMVNLSYVIPEKKIINKKLMLY